MMEVHASYARARPHRDMRKAGEGVPESGRQVRVVDREPVRLEARNLTVPEDVGVGVALGQDREALHRDHAPRPQAVTEAEGREIGRSGRMDQLAGQALRPIEPGLDDQDLVAALTEGGGDRGSGEAPAGHDHVGSAGRRHWAQRAGHRISSASVKKPSARPTFDRRASTARIVFVPFRTSCISTSSTRQALPATFTSFRRASIFSSLPCLS